MERLDALEELSVITDDRSSLDAKDVDPTSELLVISSPAAGSLSPNNVVHGQEAQEVSGAQSTSPPDSQMYVVLIAGNLLSNLLQL